MDVKQGDPSVLFEIDFVGVLLHAVPYKGLLRIHLDGHFDDMAAVGS